VSGQEDPPTVERRFTTRAVVALASILVVVGLTFGWLLSRNPGPVERMCTADALISHDGHSYSRDPTRGCRWVDENGRLKKEQ
jgi:hypothetical protein